MCWDDYDVMNGKPTGAVRVSFGYMSTYEDAMVNQGSSTLCFVSCVLVQGAIEHTSLFLCRLSLPL